MRIYAYIAAVVLILGAFAGTYWKGHQAGANGVRLDWEEANRVQRAREAAQAAEAANQLEVNREKERVVFRTITKTVDKIVDRPVYRNVCLDPDGLRVARCAIRGESPDTCKPDEPLQRAPGSDEANRSGGLTLDRGNRGVLSGLREKAARTRGGS